MSTMIYNCTNAATGNVTVLTASSFTKFVEMYILLPIIILGLIGNILAFVIWYQDGKNSVTFYLLRWLATADTLLLLTWLLQFVIPNLIDMCNPVRPYLYVWTLPLARIAYTGAIWMVVVVAAERCMVVACPQRTSTISKARQHIMAVYVGSIVFHLPSWFVKDVDPVTLKTIQNDIARNKHFQLIYDNILYCTVNYAVPLIVLTILNFKLISTLLSARQSRRQLRLEPRRQDIGSILILVVIVIIFMICHAPMVLSFILWNCVSGSTSKQTITNLVYLSDIATIMTTLNSSVNFIAYCALSSKFREMAVIVCINAQERISENYQSRRRRRRSMKTEDSLV